MISKDYRVALFGDGWGAVAAFKSLRAKYSVEYHGKELEIINALRSTDLNLDGPEKTKSQIIICAGYKPIITEQLLKKHTIINIHYSLLPKYRGLHSTAWAILNNEPFLGYTIHLMNEFVDDGPIIYQEKVKNFEDWSLTHFMEYFNLGVEKNLARVIEDFRLNKINPTEQDLSKASWVGKRGKEHNVINFSHNISHIKNMFRILSPPYPYPKIILRGDIYTIRHAQFHESYISNDVGRVLNINDEGVYVSCVNGYIIINQLYDEHGDEVLIKNILKLGQFV